MIFAPRVEVPDLTPLVTGYRDTATAERLDALATHLDLSVPSLRAYHVGWAASYSAWAFPMTDPATGRITGIRLRTPAGRKFSATGGKEALFVPDALTDDEPLLVLEGETDALAAHAVGFRNAVGRPSCTGGTGHLVAPVRARNPACVVIIRDNDGPGLRGAGALATALALHARDVRVIAPPEGVKDVREWVAAGATRDDLEQHVRAAPVRRLN